MDSLILFLCFAVFVSRLSWTEFLSIYSPGKRKPVFKNIFKKIISVIAAENYILINLPERYVFHTLLTC